VVQAQAPVAPKLEPTATPVPPTPTPTATPVTASSTIVGGLPAGLDVNERNGNILVVDASGVLWTRDPSRPSFNRPINLDRSPVDIAVDQTTGNAFVSARNAPAVLVLDPAGRQLKTIDLPVSPGDVVVDSDLGLLYVALPEQQALGVIDMRAGRLLRTVNGLPQITSLALDADRHVLYAGHLGGQVTSVDVASSQVTGRVTATGVGLSGVATARGLAYAVNTVSRELSVVEPVSQSVSRFVLNDEPAAVAASEDSGTVFVLATRPGSAIVRLDPTDGSEVGRVLLTQRPGRFSLSTPGQGQFQGLRARLVVSRGDDSLYVTQPEAGSLSVIAGDQFPSMAYQIPSPDLGDAVVAATIPGVIRPAAASLPDAPGSALAQAPADANSEETR
jgi:DNA-binding beta-propeller fold protein YncE